MIPKGAEMKRALWLGLAVVALFASMAAVSTSAFGLGLPENLPVAVKARTWKGKQTSKENILKAGETEVKCKKASAEGEEEAGKPLGPFHMTLEECKSILGACTSPGDAKEQELVLGTWHLVFDEKGATFTKLATAMLLLIPATKPATWVCGGIATIEVSGEVLCLHLNPTVKSTTHEFECGGEANKEDNWCKEDKVVGGVDKCEGLTKPVLLSSINKGAGIVSEEVAKGNVVTTEEIFADI
jgi:hypothetical protein